MYQDKTSNSHDYLIHTTNNTNAKFNTELYNVSNMKTYNRKVTANKENADYIIAISADINHNSYALCIRN